MSVFDTLVRHGLPVVPKLIVGRVARRYVAGATLDDAVNVIRELNREGAMATVDLLGEEVTERSKAAVAVAEYLRLLEVIAASRLDCNLSIKLTMLGLKIEEPLCAGQVAAIARRAAELSNFVRIDMEDSICTDATLRIYRQALAEHGRVGAVLQAYLRRTSSDVGQLLPLRPNIRICKGIYREPRAIAWQDFETVRANFVDSMERLMAGGAYVAIATHDPYLVWAGMRIASRLGLAPSQYEFQMLLGVDPELRRIIIAGGHRLRVYVPFGRDWYPYSVRRLRENPTVARHVVRAMVSRSHRRTG
jgi:proline dehydrogenase